MNMTAKPALMQAVEKLGYRVTAGDVAAAGLDVKLAERDLQALAAEAGGHLQVSESGEIAYQFPENFRSILRNKDWKLRWQERLGKLWGLIFYVIRISFGIYLIASLALILIAITILVIALNSSRDGDSGDSMGDWGGSMGSGGWGGGNWFFFFTPNYYSQNRYYGQSQGQSQNRSRQRRSGRGQSEPESMNFLESIFSFLFGDGNPNADLEERRWQSIGRIIRNSQGAVIAEQILPYLDSFSPHQDPDDQMLPVLSRFNGRPEVSPEGQIIYHFPELQVSAVQTQTQAVAAYLKETAWKFSHAGTGQILTAIGLGGANLVGALVLGGLLSDGSLAAQIGGLVGFAASIYWLLLGYGLGFLGIPLIRYFWVQSRNRQVEARNEQRQSWAVALNQADQTTQQKLDYAREFAAIQVVDASDLAYSTEQDLSEQELRRADQIDAEWQRRLDSRLQDE
jgi:hypothetical protein